MSSIASTRARPTVAPSHEPPPRPAPDAVFNQVPPLAEHDLFAADRGLQDAVRREVPDADVSPLHAIGVALADPRNAEWAAQANRYPPVWNSFDAQGRRVDRIDFHPAWHALMEGIVARGFHASPWQRDAGPHAHLLRAAGYVMQGRVEHGTLCPTTMTYGAVAALRKDDWARTTWVPKIVTRDYDPRDLPVEQKRGALVGMGMTEKQGGSDVRDEHDARRRGRRTLSADRPQVVLLGPQIDAHLVLAYAFDAGRDLGLSCFLVPRMRPTAEERGARPAPEGQAR